MSRDRLTFGLGFTRNQTETGSKLSLSHPTSPSFSSVETLGVYPSVAHPREVTTTTGSSNCSVSGMATLLHNMVRTSVSIGREVLRTLRNTLHGA